MKIYNRINDFAIDKYFALNYLLEKITSKWENFVCNFFGWDSYYLPSLYKVPKKNKSLKEILGEKITSTFDVKFSKRGVTLTRKLEPDFT